MHWQCMLRLGAGFTLPIGAMLLTPPADATGDKFSKHDASNTQAGVGGRDKHDKHNLLQHRDVQTSLRTV